MASVQIANGSDLEVSILAATGVFAGFSVSHTRGTGPLSVNLPVSSTPFHNLPSVLCYFSSVVGLPSGSSQPLILEWCAWASRIAAGGDASGAAAHLGAAVSALPPSQPYLAGGTSPSVADIACATLFPTLSIWVDAIAGPSTARLVWWGAVPAAAAGGGSGKKRSGGAPGEEGGEKSGKKVRDPGSSAASTSAAVLALATYTTSAPIDATHLPAMSIPVLEHLGALFTGAIVSAYPGAGLEDLVADMTANVNSNFVHH